jgi:hypothetical protein
MMAVGGGVSCSIDGRPLALNWREKKQLYVLISMYKCNDYLGHYSSRSTKSKAWAFLCGFLRFSGIFISANIRYFFILKNSYPPLFNFLE